jgi:hypothetical protein
MKKTLISLIALLFAASLFAGENYDGSNARYGKWKDPSYFRGYNILYESPKTLQDFIDFKNYGGNLFHIQPDGFLGVEAPYDLVQANIDGCDNLVSLCRQAGIHYVIGMRSGPGAYDTFDESQGTVGESRIWNDGNTVEQDKYAEMLRMVIMKYGHDTLFVGLNMVIEPRPKVRVIPANTSANYKFFLENVYNIHMDRVYQKWVTKIRQINTEVPIIVESFGYSTPELFPGYVINDPYIIYSAHNYQPVEYSKATPSYSKSYPGVYWNLSTLSQVRYDADFMRNTVFSKLRDFQLTTDAPVFIGEMGMYKTQNGSAEYLGDILNICTDYGWHFAFWDWRRGPSEDWNIEKFTDEGSLTWKTVLSKFNAPPVPAQVFPVDRSKAPLNPSFKWDSMTAFTTYDLEIGIFGGRPDNNILVTDIKNAGYTFDTNILTEGQVYAWRVRAKNPGGNPENCSQWSASRIIIANSEANLLAENKPEYRLNQNWPNPFNPSTNIKFSISSNSAVRLIVYDLVGREVSRLVDAYKVQGDYSVMFDASSLASGVYIYKLEALPENGKKGFTEIKKMILLK